MLCNQLLSCVHLATSSFNIANYAGNTLYPIALNRGITTLSLEGDGGELRPSFAFADTEFYRSTASKPGY